MRHDPNDLRSQIRFWILPKKHTLKQRKIKIEPQQLCGNAVGKNNDAELNLIG